MATTLVFLPGEFHGQRSLAGYSSWGCKELDTTETNTFHYQKVIYHKSLFLTPMGWVVSISRLFLTYLWEVLWCTYIIRRERISQV